MVGYSTSEFRSIYVKKTVYLVKKKLKKRLHPPDTYYDLLHINFEILGTHEASGKNCQRAYCFYLITFGIYTQRDNLQW